MMEEKFLDFVAEIMNTERSEVSMDMKYNTGLWDYVVIDDNIWKNARKYFHEHKTNVRNCGD